MLYPVWETTDSDNDTSIVTMLSCWDTDVVLTGDAPSTDESVLLDRGCDLGAEVLKVGHHGSRYSSSEPFLNAVAPEVAIISVGKGNGNGHPDAETLRRLAERGVTVLRTDQDGTITVTIGETGYEVGFEHEPEKRTWTYLPLIAGPEAVTQS